LASGTNTNPPYLLLPLQYKSRCPKVCLLARGASCLGGRRVRAAKALVVSEPMAIFYAGHGKS